MKNFGNFFQKLVLEDKKATKRWRTFAGILAVIVTFTTTYSLILPAITVSNDQVAEVPGLYPDGAEEDFMIVEDVDEQSDQIDDSFTAQTENKEDHIGALIEEDDDKNEEQEGILIEETEEETEKVEAEETEAVEAETEVKETEAAVRETEAAEIRTEAESETGTEETEAKTEVRAEEETEAETEAFYPAQVFKEMNDGVKVIVTAPEGAFPEGTTMTVSSVEDEDILKDIEEAAVTDSTSDTTKVSRVKAVDICFKDAEGNEIEPLAPVRVCMLTESKADIEEAVVIHVDDNGNAQTVEDASVTTTDDQDRILLTQKKTGQAEDAVDAVEDNWDKQNAHSEFEFKAELFSVYAVVYTVDFHWEVNGKEYEFSLEGGDSIGLRELVEALNVLDLDEETDNTEAIDEFFSDIESARFSNEDLVKVIPINQGMTAGALKQKWGLEPEYSSYITSSRREEMDSKIYYAPNLALFAMKAFNTEEYLTVKMKNGEIFEIKVTDAQLSRETLTADGENYRITVCYDEDAQIPESAELHVREILSESEEYESYLSVARVRAGVRHGDKVYDNYARFFDIEIKAEGEKIEPRSNVFVKFELSDAPEEKKDALTVVHFDEEDGPVVMDTDVENANDIRVEASSFSTYAVIANSDDEPNPYNLAGRSFKIKRSGTNRYATNENKGGDPQKIGKGDVDAAATWTFEPAEQPGEYYISTTGQYGEKVYLHMAYRNNTSANVTVRADGTGQDQMSKMSFSVTDDNDGNFYISHTINGNTYYLNEWDNQGGNGYAAYAQGQSNPGSRLTFESDSTGPTVQRGGQYAVIIKNPSNNKYYAVKSNGALIEVIYHEDTNTVELDYPLTWTYTSSHDGINDDTYGTENDPYFGNDPMNIRVSANCRGFNPGNKLPDGSHYFRYIAPAEAKGLYTEAKVEEGGNPSHNDAKYANGIRYVDHKIQGYTWNNGWVLGDYIGADFDNLCIVGNQSEENAAEVYFAQITGVPSYSSSNETVDHIDIGVLGSVDVDMPLVAGKYYDKYGNLVCEATKENRLEGNLKAEDVDINKEDIMAGTLVATDKYGNPVENAFVITGYTANSETNHSHDQVRMEGSFKVSTLPGGSNNDENHRHERLENQVYYKFTTQKQLTLPVFYNGTQLYDMNHEPIMVTVNVQLTESFSYWDERNECPPVKEDWEVLYTGHPWERGRANRAWKDGYIIDYDFDGGISGMDFILGDKGGEANVMAVQVVKMIVDEDGNPIEPNKRVTNTFYVYENTENVHPVDVRTMGTDPDHPVSDDPNDGTAYNTLHDYIATFPSEPIMTTKLDIADSHIGSFYDYDVDAGMVYVREDSTSLQEGGENYTIIDKNGKKWTYKETRTETEYVWRGYNGPSAHYADGYTCVPEVLGDYLNDSGGLEYNTFLEFYFYNVYESEPGKIQVEKKWDPSGVEIPDGAEVSVVLKRFRLQDEHVPSDKGIIHVVQTTTGDARPGGFKATYTLYKEGVAIKSAPYDESMRGASFFDLDPGEYEVVCTSECNEGYIVTPQTDEKSATVVADQTTEVTFTTNVNRKDVPERGVVWVHSDGTHKWSEYESEEYDYSAYYEYGVGQNVTITFDNNNPHYNPYYGHTVTIIPYGQSPSVYLIDQGHTSFNFTVPDDSPTTGIDVEIIVSDTSLSNWENILKSNVLTFNPPGTPVSGPAIVTGNSSNGVMGRRMLNASSGAPLRASSDVRNNKQTPEAPEGKFYEEDDWTYTVILDKDAWVKVIGGGTGVGEVAPGLVQKDANGNDYLYYIASVSESGVPDGTMLKIVANGDYILTTTAVPLDQTGELLSLTATNTVPGSLKITKKVKVDDIDGDDLPDAIKSLADGTYTFGVYTDSSASIPATKLDGTAAGPVTITITDGVSTTVEVDGLAQGTYYVKETGSTNTNGVILDQSVHTVTVTAGKSGSSVGSGAIAEVTNELNRDAELIITKTILGVEEGDLSRVADNITIKVIDADNHTILNNVKITGSPFTINDGVYTATLKSTDNAAYAQYIVPGGIYTVTETMTDVADYARRASVYSITAKTNISETNAVSGTGYTLQLTDAVTSTGRIDYTNTYMKLVDVDVTKTWGNGHQPPEGAVIKVKLTASVPGENQGDDPVSIGDADLLTLTGLLSLEVTLDGGTGAAGNVVAVDTSSEPWYYKWENLPKYDNSGKEITYSVTETLYKIGNDDYTDDLPGHVKQGAAANNLIVTNDFPPTDFEFNKAWTINGTDTYLEWPTGSTLESITFKLTRKAAGSYENKPADQTLTFTAKKDDFWVAANSATVDTNPITDDITLQTQAITADEGTAYKYTVEGLDSVWTIEDNDGNVIYRGDWEYTIEETQVQGYNAPRYQDKDGDEGTLTSHSDGCTVINDQSSVELPHTGGPGTRFFTILGSLLTAGSAYLLMLRRKRRLGLWVDTPADSVT